MYSRQSVQCQLSLGLLGGRFVFSILKKKLTIGPNSMGSKLLIKPLDFIHQNTQNLTSTFDSFDSYSDSTLFMIDDILMSFKGNFRFETHLTKTAKIRRIRNRCNASYSWFDEGFLLPFLHHFLRNPLHDHVGHSQW